MPADSLPYIGRYTPVSNHLWTAAGFRKWGMSNATMAAEILVASIAGREHSLAKVFDANRTDVLKAAPGVAKEMAKDAKHFVGDRIRHRDAPVVHAPRLQARLEHRRDDVGLPVPRLALRHRGRRSSPGPATKPLKLRSRG